MQKLYGSGGAAAAVQKPFTNLKLHAPTPSSPFDAHGYKQIGNGRHVYEIGCEL